MHGFESKFWNEFSVHRAQGHRQPLGRTKGLWEKRAVCNLEGLWSRSQELGTVELESLCQVSKQSCRGSGRAACRSLSGFLSTYQVCVAEDRGCVVLTVCPGTLRGPRARMYGEPVS